MMVGVKRKEMMVRSEAMVEVVFQSVVEPALELGVMVGEKF